jgi:hypothetical protein
LSFVENLLTFRAMHHERMFDNQPLPETIDVNIVKDLKDIGGSINGLPESELFPNCQIKTFDGDFLPAVWYPHTKIAIKERRSFSYDGVDYYGNDKKYSFLPSAWVLTENNWLPLVTRLLRIIGSDELKQAPDIFERVSYFGGGSKVDRESIMNGDVVLLTSLGAAENPYYITYLSTDKDGNLLPSATMNNWLILDTKSVGYKPCGIGKRVYGSGCYFGGFWTCGDRGSARNVDGSVCKVKNPPWPTRYFYAVIDDVVFNAGGGSSIKAGRIKILNEDQKQNIPDWVQLVNS